MDRCKLDVCVAHVQGREKVPKIVRWIMMLNNPNVRSRILARSFVLQNRHVLLNILAAGCPPPCIIAFRASLDMF